MLEIFVDDSSWAQYYVSVCKCIDDKEDTCLLRGL